MNRVVSSQSGSENSRLPTTVSDHLSKLFSEIKNNSSGINPDQLAEGLICLNHPRNNPNSPVTYHVSWHMADALEREMFRAAKQIKQSSPSLISALGAISLNKFSTETGIQRSLELLDAFDLPVCHYVAALIISNKESSDIQYFHALNYLVNCDRELALESASKAIEECSEFRTPIALSVILDHFPKLAPQAVLYLRDAGREDLVLSSGIDIDELVYENQLLPEDSLFKTYHHDRGPDDIVTLGLYAWEAGDLTKANYFLDKMHSIRLSYAARCTMVTAAGLALKDIESSKCDHALTFSAYPKSVSELFAKVFRLSD